MHRKSLNYDGASPFDDTKTIQKQKQEHNPKRYKENELEKESKRESASSKTVV